MIRSAVLAALLVVPAISIASTNPIECMRDTKRLIMTSVLNENQALRLCAGTKAATATIDCFRDAIRSNGLDLNVEQAIELCRER